MSLGLKVGFKKTLYFNAGVLTGFCIITLLCAFFCAKLNEWIPEIRLPMLVLGTLYLIWLAVKILRSTYDTKAVEPKKRQAYLWFVTAVCKRKSNGVGHRLHPNVCSSVLSKYRSACSVCDLHRDRRNKL